ncbi:MAG: winged helix-turn-helix domain-containing protein [Nanoarchaeota archaeon]
MKKRNRLEIIRDILNVIRAKNGKIKPTHILYKSNLSHSMMEEYMTELKEKEFITEKLLAGKKTYAITEKGIEYLHKYQLIADFTQSFGLEEEG